MPSKKFETKLSSAGLVYAHFGKRLISQLISETNPSEELVEIIFDKVYEKFMEEVDANDNGIPTHDGKARYAVTTTLASRVANLRPAWNDADQDFDKGFYKAMDLVWPEFHDRVQFYVKVWWPARKVVAKALEDRFNVHESGKILLLENGGCPFKVFSTFRTLYFFHCINKFCFGNLGTLVRIGRRARHRWRNPLCSIRRSTWHLASLGCWSQRRGL